MLSHLILCFSTDVLASSVALAPVVSCRLPIQIPFIPHFSQLQPFSLVARSVTGGIDSYFPLSLLLVLTIPVEYLHIKHARLPRKGGIEDQSINQSDTEDPSDPKDELSPFPSAFSYFRDSAPRSSQRATHTHFPTELTRFNPTNLPLLQWPISCC